MAIISGSGASMAVDSPTGARRILSAHVECNRIPKQKYPGVDIASRVSGMRRASADLFHSELAFRASLAAGQARSRRGNGARRKVQLAQRPNS